MGETWSMYLYLQCCLAVARHIFQLMKKECIVLYVYLLYRTIQNHGSYKVYKRVTGQTYNKKRRGININSVICKRRQSQANQQ